MHRHGKAQPSSGKLGSLKLAKPTDKSKQTTIQMTPKSGATGVAKQLPSAESSRARAAGPRVGWALTDLSHSDGEGDTSECDMTNPVGLSINELPAHEDEDDGTPALPTVNSAWGGAPVAAAAAASPAALASFGAVTGIFRCLGCDRKAFAAANGYAPSDAMIQPSGSASTSFMAKCARCAPASQSRPAQAKDSRSVASAPAPTPQPAQRGSVEAEQILVAAAALEAEAASGSFVPSTSQSSPAPAAAPVATASAPASPPPPPQATLPHATVDAPAAAAALCAADATDATSSAAAASSAAPADPASHPAALSAGDTAHADHADAAALKNGNKKRTRTTSVLVPGSAEATFVQEALAVTGRRSAATSTTTSTEASTDSGSSSKKPKTTTKKSATATRNK